MSIGLGVDIGGTKIQFCRIASDLTTAGLGATPTALMRRGTPRFADDLVMLIRAMLPPGADRVAVSLNGVLDRGRVVYSSLMGGRVGFPLERFLADQLGVPVMVDDDIHAMAIAEARIGEGQDDQPFALLNLGTGIGVGCFADGRVLRGAYAAGLISEQTVYVDELAEWRSLDRTVCGRGLRDIYLGLSGEAADAVTVFARHAAGGDAHADRTVAIFSRVLGKTMQMISRFHHPATIVLNGSIKRAAHLYLDSAVEHYRAGLEPAFHARVAVSRLDHAAEIGVLVAGPHDVMETL